MTASLLPMTARIRRRIGGPGIADVGRAVADELARVCGDLDLRGMRVGITAGSRGIDRIVEVLSSAASFVRAAGGEPVLLAAMGSHGGGTEAGQREVLASLGVTEESVSAPIAYCAESELVGTTPDGLDAYALRSARSVDTIIAVNRVKVHTAFHGAVESGLHKSIVVGLGGPKGAAQFHSRGARELPGMLLSVGALLLERLPIAAGIAIVENASERAEIVRGVRADAFAHEEPLLLDEARRLMPRLPVDELDALIVEEMGKNFSGTGMDTNIISRFRIEGLDEPETPRVARIAVLALSEESHGNANGVGLADITTQALVDAMDRRATYLNCVTTGFLNRGAIPVHGSDERSSLEMLVRSLGERDARRLRLVQIPNTLRIGEIFVSESVLCDLREDVDVIEPLAPMTFDGAGRLARRIGPHI